MNKLESYLAALGEPTPEFLQTLEIAKYVLRYTQEFFDDKLDEKELIHRLQFYKKRWKE